MTRDDVINFCKLFYFNKLDSYSIINFIYKYCVYRGKDSEQSKVFAPMVLQSGTLSIISYAIEWCEKEFSINKLYSAPNPNGERSIIQIF